MAKSLPKKFVCRSDLVAPYLDRMNLCDIANQSRISEKTLRKIMRGEGVAFASVKKLARWLQLHTHEVLQDITATLAQASDTRVDFRLELSLDVAVSSKHQGEAIIHHLLLCLKNKGIRATVFDSRITQDEHADGRNRVLVRLRGTWTSDNPPYIYIAVRPSRYLDFVKVVQSEPIDLRRFEKVGEIIGDLDVRPVSEMLQYPSPIPEYAVGPCRYALERVSEPFFRSLISPDGRGLTSFPRPGQKPGVPRPAVGKDNNAGEPKYLELALPEDILYNLLWIDRIHGLDWLE